MGHQLGHGTCPACQEQGALLMRENQRLHAELEFMASTEKGRLRAVNAKLTSALEAMYQAFDKGLNAKLTGAENAALNEARATLGEANK